MTKQVKNLLTKVLIALTLVSVFFTSQVQPAQAQASGPNWLSFDGQAPSDARALLGNLSQNSVSLRVEVPGVQFQAVEFAGQTFTQFSGESFVFGGETGTPELPVYVVELEIPQGAEYQLQVSNVISQTLSLQSLGINNPIIPVQPPFRKAENPDAPVTSYEANYMAQTGFMPAQEARVSSEYVLRDHRVLQIEVSAARFSPSTSEIQLISSLDLQVTYTGGNTLRQRLSAQPDSASPFNGLLSERVLNFNSLNGVQADQTKAASNQNYLIITADPYRDAINRFVALKQSQGFNVFVRTISELGGNNANMIRSQIVSFYNSPSRPSYVLLVGDYGTDTYSITNWNFYTSSDPSARTDLYYFTMDAGPSQDYVPDVIGGRLPVHSVAQLDAVIDKYIAYNSSLGYEAWNKKAAFLATNETLNNFYKMVEDTHNSIIRDYTAPLGYTGTFPINPNQGGDQLYALTKSANGNNVVQAFNDSRSIVVYSGHGNQIGWADPNLYSSAISSLHGSAVPFVASLACLTGDFSYQGNSSYPPFAEAMVNASGTGAITLFAASSYTYWYEDNTLERALFDALYADPANPPSVGEAAHAGLTKVMESRTPLRQYYWEAYHLFGDPSFTLRLEPKIQLTH